MAPGELARGASLGRYVVLDRIGASAVYGAFDPQLDRKLAIKLMPPHAAPDAQALARLTHPNLVAVHDVGHVGQRVFVVMDHVKGVSLREWLAAEPRTWREIVDVFAQAGRGLVAAQAAGLPERELDLERVLVGKDGRVRVLAFSATGAASFARALDEALADRAAPARVRELARGKLAIAQLVDELARDPDLTRRRWAAGGAALVVAAALVVGLRVHAAARPGPEPCNGARAQLAGIWDTPRKSAVRSAFAATGVPFQADAWRSVERALDGYADRWAAMHTEACQATRVRHVQSEELLDLRMECLARKLQQLQAQVDVLASADAQLVSHAVDTTGALGGLEACADEAALRAATPLPDDPLARARIAETRAEMARATALDVAGRYPQAMPIAVAAAEQARMLRYPPLSAEALVELGELQNADGREQTALDTLHAAVLEAEKAGDRAIAARAWTSLVFVSNRLHRFDDAELFGRHARAVLELGGNETLRSALLVELGNLASSQGNDDQALPLYREALAIRQKLLPPDDPHIASVLDNMGLALVQLGKYEDALEDHRRALAIGEKSLGAEHPDVAGSLSNVGIVLHLQHKDAEALEYHRRALAILEKVLGPTHPDVGSTWTYIGDCLAGEDDAKGAYDAYERAFAIEQAALGPDHPNLAYELIGMAEAKLYLKDAPAAVELFERALALREHHPVPPLELAEARYSLARALWKAGKDRGRAVQLAKVARASYVEEGTRAEDLAHIDHWIATHPAP